MYHDTFSSVMSYSNINARLGKHKKPDHQWSGSTRQWALVLVGMHAGSVARL